MAQNFQLQKKVFLAPMAGITDAPMRRMVNKKSHGKAVLVSEMVAVNALSRKNSKTYRIADVRPEPYPVIVQLEGSDFNLFAEAALLAKELGAVGIDLNMGCPVRKVINGGAGSALMRTPDKASKIIQAVANSVKVPVSVKFRKGWDNDHINAVDFAKMCEDSGAAFIAVHGRTRAQGYSGVADWKIIADVKRSVNIPVVGNGDVASAQDAKKMIEETGCDAVMVGRAALGAPWLLEQISDYLECGKNPENISLSEMKNTVLEHVSMLEDFYGKELAVSLSRKYVCWYSKNLHDAKRFRENYMKIADYNQALAAIDEYFSHTTTDKEGA